MGIWLWITGVAFMGLATCAYLGGGRRRRWTWLLLATGCAAPAPPPRPLPPPVPPPTLAAPRPVAPPPVPSLPPCPGGDDGPLSPEQLADVPLPDNHALIANTLGVDCPAEAPNYGDVFAQAVARFQQRHGRFADEIDGIVGPRTQYTLQLIHPALRRENHPCGGRPDVAPLPACLLRWPDATGEQRAFMERVYDIARERADRRRDFFLASDEVGIIETGPCPGKPAEREPGCTRTSWAQRDAAVHGRRLLEAARAHFGADPKKHGQRDLMVFTGYRSAAFQLEIWEYHFPGRYRATARARRRARGGPHGEAAALLLAQHYAARTAAPGFSLHGRGVALDFGCVTKDGGWIGSTGSFTRAWKRSACFAWLKANAEPFGFRLNPNIDEPWHWEWHQELVRAEPTE